MSQPSQKIPIDFRIAVVSGKGGVGKTMLAVAIAYELAAKNRTLLLDLDFFNRGLTGLLRQGKKLKSIKPPAFFAAGSEDEPQEEDWELIEVAPNPVHVRYGDLSQRQMSRLEMLNTRALTTELGRFLDRVAKEADCKVMVMDCHGGPDHLSFAAADCANVTLLVSEPDKITFYGTLHFVRQLESVSGERKPDIRLVFNKVIPCILTAIPAALLQHRGEEHF
jgi:cellulose biosynthesis protein BcsQ